MELLVLILASMGGGIFAAILGATNAFIFTGFMGLIGVSMQLAGGGDSFVLSFASGPFLAPHIAFNAGVVALAVTKRLYSNGVAKDLDGTDAFMPLYKYKKSIPILVAGAVGGLGFLLNLWFTNNLSFKIDTIALVIVIFNLLTRLLIGKTGIVPNENPKENRYKETNKNIVFNLIWGTGFAGVIAYITLITGNPFLGFYMSAASLIFMAMGKDMPFSHHISLISGYAALQGNSIWLGILLGALSIPVFEYIQATVNPKADTLIEVSTMTIMLFSILIFNFL